jgi:cell division protease FtsH
MDRSIKTALFWILIVVSAILLWRIVRAPQIARSPEITYSAFIAKARVGEIASVIITGDQIEGEYRNGAGAFHLTGPSNAGVFLQILQDKGVEIRFRDVPETNLPLQLIGTWAPLILLGALWFFMIRQIGRRRPPGASGVNLDPRGGLG